MRYKSPLSLSILDIDYFKKVNDTFGHSIGDEVMKAIADIIKANNRDTSYLFRWGGEEFVIIVTEADIEGARIHAERLRKAIEEHAFEKAGTITASFGVAQYMEGDTPDSLLKRADSALYKAKFKGRNRVEG